MLITKPRLKILNYIYSKGTVSYSQLKKKFKRYHDLAETLESLAYHNYIEQIVGHQSNLGEPIPITDQTLFTLDELGIVSVEQAQWFDSEYIVSHVVIPIVLAVISTLITIFLTNVL